MQSSMPIAPSVTHPFEHHHHVHINTIHDEVPGGILAKILHNVRECPLAVRIAAVVIPILIAFTFYSIYYATLPADHLFRAVMPLASLVIPFFSMYEGTSLMNEFLNQFSYDYRPGAHT